jgi:hypothetical protein
MIWPNLAGIIIRFGGILFTDLSFPCISRKEAGMGVFLFVLTFFSPFKQMGIRQLQQLTIRAGLS